MFPIWSLSAMKWESEQLFNLNPAARMRRSNSVHLAGRSNPSHAFSKSPFSSAIRSQSARSCRRSAPSAAILEAISLLSRMLFWMHSLRLSVPSLYFWKSGWPLPVSLQSPSSSFFFLALFVNVWYAAAASWTLAAISIFEVAGTYPPPETYPVAGPTNKFVDAGLPKGTPPPKVTAFPWIGVQLGLPGPWKGL